MSHGSTGARQPGDAEQDFSGRDERGRSVAHGAQRDTRPPVHPLLGGIFLSLAPFALIGLQRTFRTSPHHSLPEGGRRPSAADPDFPEWVEHLTRAVFRPGNAVEVLCNGEGTFPRLWSDLEGAQRSIDFQVYYAESGVVADRTFGILEQKARAGLRVRFLYDPAGFRGLSGDYLQALRDAGAGVYPQRPLHLAELYRANHRAHARIVLIDGRIGYTGDFGISDRWLGDGHSAKSWRSTNARFFGPALREHAAAFAVLWAEATGELDRGEGLSADPVHTGGKRAALLHTSPGAVRTPAERLWALTIGAARETCYIASGYFAPNDAQMRLLVSAAQRGVDVRVLTASARHADVPPAYWAGWSRYPELLRAGVCVHEYQPSMMHAKSWVVDGVWCSVGALNLDNRSVTLNDEVALLLHDAGVGEHLTRLFHGDLARSRRITLADVESGGWWDQARAWGARRISHLL